jgi:hypothetical protein
LLCDFLLWFLFPFSLILWLSWWTRIMSLTCDMRWTIPAKLVQGKHRGLLKKHVVPCPLLSALNIWFEFVVRMGQKSTRVPRAPWTFSKWRLVVPMCSCNEHDCQKKTILKSRDLRSWWSYFSCRPFSSSCVSLALS